MLISPILTVMSVYSLPGGQLLSRGYVANFSQDITQLCKTLPRLTSEIPLLIVKKIDQNNNSKDFKVCRHRVETLLKYLCENNPDWKKNNIKYNSENIYKLPVDGIPIDLNEIVNNTSADTFDQVIIETGRKMMRQQNLNNDPAQAHFIELLPRLRNGTSTIADWKLLQTRTPSEKNNKGFENAITIYNDNDSVDQKNYEQLIKKINQSLN